MSLPGPGVSISGRDAGGRSREARLRADRARRLFGWCAVGFVGAAVVVAVVNAIAPVAHGWWLVAYLALVGGLSQALLGTGPAAVVAAAGARQPGEAATWSGLALWNTGTLVVAIADLADAPAGVLTGSVLLLTALGVFAMRLRTIVTARLRLSLWVVGYALLLVFLAGSVLVGAALAEALPGQ
jgi:hypothetical protein